MKKSKNNKYSINQSPLYKVSSHASLAKILFIEPRTVKVILKNGDNNYYFSTLPESDRSLEIPKSQLRRIHARINNLFSRIEAPAYLNSGVKGRSNIKNAKDHLGDKALVKIDIKKFYPSTTEGMVEKCFIKIFRCSKDVAKTLSKLCCVNGHLPTGSPISQSLAFYVNMSIFKHLSIYSKARNIVFSVYVDDMTFSGKVIPKNFVGYVTSYIEKSRGYRCHKIRTYNASTPKVVTGAVITGETLKVKNAQRNTISKLLLNLDENVNNYDNDSLELVKYFQVLIGHLFSAGQINGRYYQKGKEVVKYRKILEIKLPKKA